MFSLKQYDVHNILNRVRKPDAGTLKFMTIANQGWMGYTNKITVIAEYEVNSRSKKFQLILETSQKEKRRDFQDRAEARINDFIEKIAGASNIEPEALETKEIFQDSIRLSIAFRALTYKKLPEDGDFRVSVHKHPFSTSVTFHYFDGIRDIQKEKIKLRSRASREALAKLGTDFPRQSEARDGERVEAETPRTRNKSRIAIV